MGYMGFGMQKWIYSRRARKPFTRRSLETGDTVEKYTVGDLNIKGRTHRTHLSPEERKETLRRISRRSLNNKILNIIISVSLITITVVVLVNIKPWKANGFSEQYILDENRKELVEKSEVFELSMEYGKSYLKRNAYESAIKEFRHALKVFPEDKEALDYLVKAYVKDCISNDNNCDTAKKILSDLIRKYPENFDYMSYRISIEK